MYLINSTVLCIGRVICGRADDLQEGLTELVRLTVDSLGRRHPVVSIWGLDGEAALPCLAGALPLLESLRNLECTPTSFCVSCCTSVSWRQAVPATLIFRKRMELLVKVPVLSEKM